VKHIHLSAALVFGLSAMGLAPALAQTIDGSAVEDILALAKSYGEASLETQSNGQPRIAGKAGDVPYQVFFLNCDSGTCEDLDFYAGFAGIKPTMDSLNAWNRDKRFGRAYLDGDLDAVIEYDINLEYGVTRDNLNAAFGVWSLVLGEFAGYVGFGAEAQ
jgi:hypothetical protein